jgi:hypothetical protein
MKIKVNSSIKHIFSKHFLQRLPKITLSIDVNLKDFKGYWDKCAFTLKKNSLCFFSKDLIDFVNKTNNKLLCNDLLQRNKSSATTTLSLPAKDFVLLNAFEMLWNIESE